MRIEIDGNHAVTADTERDPTHPSGDGRIAVYIGAGLVLTMTPATADQLGDALADLADARVVYRT